MRERAAAKRREEAKERREDCGVCERFIEFDVRQLALLAVAMDDIPLALAGREPNLVAASFVEQIVAPGNAWLVITGSHECHLCVGRRLVVCSPLRICQRQVNARRVAAMLAGEVRRESKDADGTSAVDWRAEICGDGAFWARACD